MTTTTLSDIFIKNCQEKNVGKDLISHFSRDPQGLWDSQENPTYMLHLLSYFFGKVDSTSRKAATKCLIEIVKPCMGNIPKREKRPRILMEVLEKYCEGTATLAEVKKAQYNFNAVADNASWAVWYCAAFALGNDYYYAAIYAALPEKNKEAENQYQKNSCKIIRKHFPKIPGLKNVKAKENLNQESFITQTTVVKIGSKNFEFTSDEFKVLKSLIKDLV